MFKATQSGLTPLSRPRAPRRALAVIVAGGICAALAACGSSAASSAASAGASAASSAASQIASAESSAASAIASAASSAGVGTSGIPAADCTVIKDVNSSAISTLLPMQSESQAKAAADLAAYLTKLQADEAKLTSAQGKAALGAWIAAVTKASTQSTADATATITPALAKLGTACP